MLRVNQVKYWFNMIPLQREWQKAALHLVPSPTPDVAVIPAAEEQRLNRIVVELGVVDGAAVRLDDADGVDQRGGSQLNQIKGNGAFVHTE